LKKILVIRFSYIGDIVLSTPVLRGLKLQLGAEVHVLTKTEYAGILSPNPYVDKVISIDKYVTEVIASLRLEDYDFVVDLHHNMRSGSVKRALGKPHASVNKLNIRKFLLVYFKWNRMPPIHIAERYLQTVEKLGVKNDQKGLDFFIPPSQEVDVSSMPFLRKGYIGFAIGAQHYTKRLPTNKIISICRQINQRIVLLGGKEDEAVAEEVRLAVGEQVVNACGKYNLQQSASLVRQSKMMISHDTGLMHIAAAFKKNIVSVWGNTVPDFGMYPYLTGHGPQGAGTIAEVKGLSCRPCSKIGFQKCPKGHFKCMNLIDEALIVQSCKEE
jgi:ADP-heptose:LPS heptosyltransferase